MKKNLVAVVLFALATTAWAKVEFTPIFYMDSGVVLLVDKSTIQDVPLTLSERAKNLVTGKRANRIAWEMINTAERDAPFMSAKSLQEVNCSTGQTRTLIIYAYSKMNGDGELLFASKDISEWQYSAPATAGQALVDAVCK